MSLTQPKITAFRQCIVPSPGYVFAEADYSAIEAVITGWYAGDPTYIRLAKLGVHAYLTSHLIGRPADLSWSDEKLKEYFGEIKDKYKKAEYAQAKSVVHGCVPGDHEVLTRSGWKRFDFLSDQEEVAQWSPSGVTFTKAALTKVDIKDESLVSVTTPTLNIQMTACHRVPLKGRNGEVRVVRADSLMEHHRVPINGNYENAGEHWDCRYALDVAIQADAVFKPRWGYVVFHLVRQRKIDRLRKHLDTVGVTYRDAPCGCGSHVGRRISFRGWKPKLFTDEKIFSLPALMQLGTSAREAFLEEVLHWDGTGRVRRPGRQTCYMSTNKENVLAVQTIAHLTNMQSGITERLGGGFTGKTLLYKASINRKRFSRVAGKLSKTIPTTQTVYCVTVPTGFFLVRWKDTISVTGNSNYGLTAIGMANRYPALFTRKSAQKLQDMYFALCPALLKWQTSVRDLAHKQHYLGGPGAHPYNYKHWFWDVYSYGGKKTAPGPSGKPVTITQWSPGQDYNRVVAYYPQSTAAGVIKDAALAYRKWEVEQEKLETTAIRALIHDSILIEAKDEYQIVVLKEIMSEQVKALPCPAEWGLGPFLSFGVDVASGNDWHAMQAQKDDGFEVPVDEEWAEV